MGQRPPEVTIVESINGASASAAGDDFHELWALRKIMRLLDRKARLISVTVEGVPADEVHASLGDKAQAVDVTELFRDANGGLVFAYEQLKYSVANPTQPWTWARLTAESGPRRKASSVLGKLAAAHHRLAGKGVVRIVSNQPAAEGMVDDVARFVRALRSGQAAASSDDGLKRLRKATQLDDQALAAFLEAWDLSTFDSAARLGLQGDVLRRIGELTDADARSDLVLLQQQVAELILPSGRKHATVDRETLLTWLGAGANNALFPAPSQIKPSDFVLERAETNALTQAIIGAPAPFVRLDAPGGCGKTTFAAGLGAALPNGSVVVLYDCYGGGLFMTSDQRRHAPQQAFVQVANELAGALGSPFVLSRPSTTDLTASFARRLRAASTMIGSAAPDALIVVIFDAADNAVMAARKWNEPCFLDELLSISNLPPNIRIVLTCRTARRDWIRPPNVVELSLGPFSLSDTKAYLKALRPTWPSSTADDLQDLSGGTPRRLAYALDKTDDAEVAQARLMPKAAGMDPLFDHLVAEAGQRLGDAGAVWRVLCALAHIPRPSPAWALAQIAGLVESDIADIAADVGGIVEHGEGWTFQDEDFEGFVDEHTAELAPALLKRAVEIIGPLAESRPYAARSLGELLMRAGDLDGLYALVLADAPVPCIADEIDRRSVQARRMAIALNCCRQAGDPITAVNLLLASTKGMKTDEAIRDIIVGNLDISAALAPDAAFRLLTAHRRYTNRRGRLRVHMAAQAHTDRAMSANHMRWWRAWLEDRRGRTAKYNIETNDIVADVLAAFKVQGFDGLVSAMRTWRPAASMAPVVRELARRASRTDPQLLWQGLTTRPRRPAFRLTLLAQLVRAGEDASDPRFTDAMREIAASTSWLKRQRLDQAEVSSLLEDVLLVCEATISQPGSHQAISRLLAAALPDHDLTQSFGVHRFVGSGSRSRGLALQEIVSGQRSSVQSLLPAKASVPFPIDHGRRRPVRLTGEQEAANKACTALNSAIDEAVSTLSPLLEIARARIDASLGRADWDLPISAAAAAAERGARGHSSAYRLTKGLARQLAALLQHMALANELTPDRLRRISEILTNTPTYGEGAPVLQALSALAWTPAADDLVLQAAAELAPVIEAQPRASSERAKDLVGLARIVLELDRDLARDAFERAIRVVEHIDVQTASQLRVISAMGHPQLGDDRARARDLAERLADAASATDLLLGDDSSFPWPQIIAGLAAIDLPTAYAAISRWRDLGVLELNLAVQALLESPTGRELPATVILALATLCGQVDLDLPRRFSDPQEAKTWIDYQASDALASEDESWAETVLDCVEAEHLPAPPFLERAIGLFETWDRQARERRIAATTGTEDQAEDETERLESPTRHFATEAELREAVLSVDAESFMIGSEVREIARRVERLPLRVPLLRHVLERFPTSRALGEVIQDRYASWSSYPPVANWARDHLPDYLIGALPDLFQHDYHDTTLLEAVLDATHRDAEGQCEILFKAIAQQAHGMNSDLMYALLCAIGRRLPLARRASLMSGMIDEIEQQIPKPSPVAVRGANAPEDPTEVLAGFLFAAMGDVDRRRRWRASHAIRRMVALKDGAILGALAPMLLIQSPTPFAAIEARFYTFSARQQLAATFHRIAAENPVAVRPHVASLVMCALRAEPHVIVTSFAKAAALLVEQAFPGTLTTDELAELTRLNVSSFRPVSADRRDRPRPPRSTPKGERRCNFDDTDTIPYWYSPAARAFDVDFSIFLDRAEHWIVDQWGFDQDYTYWAKEPRTARFEGGDTSHRHGSIPTMERLSRYADWHGLMCAMGESVKLNPSVYAYGENEWEAWLKSRLLTLPDVWLADLRDPPPLEERFWRVGRRDLEDVTNGSWTQSRFDEELGLGQGGQLFVAGQFERRNETWSETVTISSALVSSPTAMALGRALQTARDRMDYILPPAEDHRAVDAPGFVLSGWLHDGRDEASFDQHDPRRGRVNGLPVTPSSKVVKRLGLDLDLASRRWRRRDHVDSFMEFSIWGDRDDEGLTSGWRTGASPDLLRQLLDGQGRSLAVEIVISGSIGRSWEERRSSRRFYIVRPDGTVEPVSTSRRSRACKMVRALKLDRSIDTLGRWLIHRADELACQVSAGGPASKRAEKELKAVIERFQTRPRHRYS